MMRAILIKESLHGEQLPPSLRGLPVREYRHQLDETAEVTIAELDVAEADALEMGMSLSRTLLPRLYYAHLLNDRFMYISFPDCLAYLARGDQGGEARAQAIGRTFGIPDSQMRFLKMFEVDHPDAPAHP